MVENEVITPDYAKSNTMNMPIDKFFLSLADDLGILEQPWRTNFLKYTELFKSKMVNNTI